MHMLQLLMNALAIQNCDLRNAPRAGRTRVCQRVGPEGDKDRGGGLTLTS